MNECLKRWPEAQVGEYDPRCCRFPKSCSIDVDHEQSIPVPGRLYRHYKGDVYEVIATGYDEHDIPQVYYRHRLTGKWYNQPTRRFTATLRRHPKAELEPRFTPTKWPQ